MFSLRIVKRDTTLISMFANDKKEAGVILTLAKIIINNNLYDEKVFYYI
ncbi:MAG: hypothetical protein N2323_06785 [candidate division WOR-3 bacterium]|nr:hypothetical protein [candidate division WOR-3 bacterium]